MVKIQLRKERKIAPLICLVALAVGGCVPLVVGAAAGAGGGVVSSAKASRENEHHSTGVHILTVASNVCYFPAKVIFAGAGAIGSGLAYIVTLGDKETTTSIWNASVLGNYLVTPNMVEGREKVRFIGP